ncbi:peptide/nickel transport system ATP-binding protein [Planomicrobium stackebrandtii]|uniref:Peptide/nickel transport system ATP-binding protein n=1 Tax=Planomicrobium stackebrandtii TaxID=253160 RepID=A0ABU0GPV4_9BACL|nr:dipeptide/oligopeptide/nickel ABC transporter ATP-binding protein [Planomicrobium stackebrandtii]MDQ0427362.1 peptide/nickel transport system ATP-binding protein [Planomicrobium stackebrandtii]
MELMKISHVDKTYSNGLKVLDNVSFSLEKGECLGIIGESGCGKSTLARCLLQLEPIDAGEISINGEPVQNLTKKNFKPFRKQMQAVFQNPSASLNPKLKIRDSLMDPYLQFGGQKELQHFSYTSKENYVGQLLEAVELPACLGDRYPHELSGGQQQRVTISRAISIEPEIMILDEPTSSLDVLSQASILKLLDNLRQQFSLSYIFISHDLAAVASLSQQLLVMKDGRMVDGFGSAEIFSHDRHPYTKELVSMF